MNNFLRSIRHTGTAVSLATVAMILSGVVNAGPGCMNKQAVGQGYQAYSPIGPYMAYGQRSPYPYYPVPAPHAGMMAAPYGQPAVYPQRMAAGVGPKGSAAETDAAATTRAAASGSTAAAGNNVTVRISGMRFEPAKVTIKPGTTVTWIHESNMPHTISGRSGELRSSTLYGGQQFSHTFEKAGNYDYLCGLHPSMKGSVVVVDEVQDS